MLGTCLAHWVAAETELPGIVTTGGGVEFKLVSLYKTTPMAGALPVRVTITNRTGKDRTWTLRGTSEVHDSQSVAVSSEFELPVPSGEARSFDLNMPLPPLAGSHHSAPGVSFTASGPGIRAGSRAYLNPTYGFGGSGTAFTVMTETIGQRLWSSLEVEAGKQKPPKKVRGSLVSMTHFPSNWLALSGQPRNPGKTLFFMAMSNWNPRGRSKRAACRLSD